MEKQRQEIIAWVVSVSEILQNKHWISAMNAEQETVDAKREVRSRRIQGVTMQARNDIKRFRNELYQIASSNDFQGFRSKCSLYLDKWDNFFYYLARYGVTGNLDDFGAATRYYNAVSTDLTELNKLLGIGGEESTVQEAEQQQTSGNLPSPREKEIIREKEVIVKIRCEYCRRTFDETLDTCPSCGARR